ncbi:hypothetical protein E4T52_02780 [Aureobasidium sp. EXF-3400]|nr:hypothetical protein E4T51_01243 [Aureobasidium sp. EXF-12344]KAI4782271.1 hypothetical protein E4T52_02780 [Aureobasidium sp. EXF-3400]
MSSSRDSKQPEIAMKDDWSRNTWNADDAIPADMINVVNTIPDDNGETFHAFVHKELLCHYSLFYAAALKDGSSESNKDTVTIPLPNDLMETLVSWLYSGIITSGFEDYLTDLYSFADRHSMLALRRSIMSRLILSQDLDADYPMDVQTAIPHLKHLPQDSGLFRYLVDYWVIVWSQTDSRFQLAALDSDRRIPRMFFYQALLKLSFRVEDKGPGRDLKIACNYHEHVNRDEWSEKAACGGGLAFWTPGRMPAEPHKIYLEEQ